MMPNKRNFCGGAFPDWLEVNLIRQCNARCAWCIERDGYHPEEKAGWHVIAEAALRHGAKNIILLGGEPTLHKDIKQIISILSAAGRDVWVTTNGSLLTADFVRNKLTTAKGVNISVHHFDMAKNKEITGINIDEETISASIAEMHRTGASVRMNCNCIGGMIDSTEKILDYVDFAKRIGADKIRFAELKQDDCGFVDLAKVLNYKYGLNDNPFACGCNSDAVISGMPVNFRQMCGLQTTRRVTPENPEQVSKKVLYYDGKIYDGWQTAKKEEVVTDNELVKLLEQVAKGEKTPAEAALAIGKELGKAKTVVKHESSGGCQY